MKRIAITGPESSGKTTLSKELATKYNSTWFREYAREYLLERNGLYAIADLDKIAKGQIQLWDSNTQDSFLFYDTEMLVLKIWSEFKYKTCSAYILSELKKQHFDHYFLCRPDIEWEEDLLREHPEQREELFDLYLTELKTLELPFTIVEGDMENRLRICSGIIQKL